jgi:hypothetical protein
MSWDAKNLPEWDDILPMLLEGENDFSNLYTSYLDICMEKWKDKKLCTEHFANDYVTYADERYEEVKRNIERIVENNDSIYRTVVVCDYDEFVFQIDKFDDKIHYFKNGYRKYDGIGRFWSWDMGLARSYAQANPNNCPEDSKMSNAVISATIPSPEDIDILRTVSTNLHLKNTEKEIAIQENGEVHIERICRHPLFTSEIIRDEERRGNKEIPRIRRDRLNKCKEIDKLADV